MSAGWVAFITLWLATASLGLLGGALVWRTSTPGDPDRLSAVVTSGLASLPSAAAALELVIRWLRGSLSGDYLTRTPLLIGLIAGPLLLVASFVVHPLVWERSERALNGMRLVHLVSWVCGAFVSAALLLSI